MNCAENISTGHKRNRRRKANEMTDSAEHANAAHKRSSREPELPEKANISKGKCGCPENSERP